MRRSRADRPYRWCQVGLPNRCMTCTPAACDRISGKDCAGECSISSAVITELEAPVITPPRRDVPTSIGGNATVFCACAACASSVSAKPAPSRLDFHSHDTTFLRLRARMAAHRVRPNPVRRTQARKRDGARVLTCWMSWEKRLSRPSHRHCRHRCERPLRMDSPSTGWVTVLAGLLARGSSPSCARPSRFPSGHMDARLAAHSCGGSHGVLRTGADSVFPLSSPE